MLRASDLLLTLAAVTLLVAALESSARSRKFVIQASSQHVASSDQQPGDMLGSRDYQTQQSFDQLMAKVKRNLEPASQGNFLRPSRLREPQNSQLVNSTNQNSYSYYADETSGQHQHQHQQAARNLREKSEAEPTAMRRSNDQYRQAQEVRVNFLRSRASPTGVLESNRSSGGTMSANNTVYLLNYLLPHLVTDSKISTVDEYANNGLSSGSSDLAAAANERLDKIQVAEQQQQQQQPPFTLFPPVQQPGAGIPNQFQQQLRQQAPNIQQILSNYQRYPQARQLSDHQRQLLTQLQPRPPELHLRPPTQAPAVGLVNPLNPLNFGLQQPQQPGQQQQQQQPLSPLQLLAGPLQAFLPGLAGQQPQPHSQPQSQQHGANVDGPQSAKSKHDSDKTDDAARGPIAPQQQPQPFGGLLNPFNLPQPGLQQQRTPIQAGGAPNLQDFYQQLPLYQALLAARQRQEALQAAQKMREQHQHQANRGNFGPAGANPLTQPQAGSQGPTPPPLAGLPFGPFGALPGSGGPSPTPSPSPDGWPPVARPVQPPLTPHTTLAPQLSHPKTPPTSNQNGPVHFDDDQPNNPQPNDDRSPQSQHPPADTNSDNNNQVGGNDDSGGQNDNDSHNNNNNNNNNVNNHNQNDQDDNHSNDNGNGQNDPTGPEHENQGGSGGRAAEEEDPDLKQFQNLANGGDSFTDLFPPGILSNNDIDDIKTQQKEQAKKQEEEERQKHRQQEQQQQFNNQRMKQFPDNQNNNNLQQSSPNQPNDQINNNVEDNNRNTEDANDANNDDQADRDGGDENQEDQQGDNEQPNGEDNNQDGGENGSEGQGDSESPEAAALTAKSSSSEMHGKKQAERWTNSPGVEYAKNS